MMEMNVGATAIAANAPKKWDDLWETEGEESWRKEAMAHVYTRICRLIPPQARVADCGGGLGFLARRLRDEAKCSVEILDISSSAVKHCIENGFAAQVMDFEKETLSEGNLFDVIVATEVLEHLTPEARDKFLLRASMQASAEGNTVGGLAFFSVPNDRLGPDEEPQHTIKFTAISFKKELQRFFNDVRVEVLGPVTGRKDQPAFLLGICGFPIVKKCTMTMPCRDEEEDIERVLASFRGFVDKIVIGIDPRSIDKTRELAEKYADKVFTLVEPHDMTKGTTDEAALGEDKNTVNFGWIRNQCIDQCTTEWIFMTEGHEMLATGGDTLLSLDQLPDYVKVVVVLRQGNGQQWGFPWLFKNESTIRFARATHNVLDFPDGTPHVKLPQVRTLHERSFEREMIRQKQRKVQNRTSLMQDWLQNQNENSLHYLGAEWREYSKPKAIQYLREYIIKCRSNGEMRYQTRLILAKALMELGGPERLKECREVLLGCMADDWTRTDHWIWLGDLMFDQGRHEEAKRWYRYGAEGIGEPPFTMWWIDLSFYSYVPAQRMAMVCGELGQVAEALVWAKKVLELLPDDAPSALFEEASANVTIIEENLSGKHETGLD